MTDRPIIFSAPMIRALLDGRKTQTRRILKDGPDGEWFVDPNPRGDGLAWVAPEGVPSIPIRLPYDPGDRLWCRETWSGDWFFHDTPPSERKSNCLDGSPHDKRDIWYWADGSPEYGDWEKPRPSIHMPRWASRLTLVVTDVRVQRVQEISEDDAEAEGAGHCDMCNGVGWLNNNPDGGEECPCCGGGSYGEDFADLWDSINAKRGFGWDANPWVAAISFTVHHHNIDQMEAA